IVIPPAIFFYYSTLFDSRFKTLQQNLHKHLAQTTDESEKEFWLKLMSHVMQLNQISVINSKEKEM
ncbi:hypothetical protein ACTMPS_14520, partial [Enterococcus faecium]